MTTKSETTVERVGGYRVVRRLATGGTSDLLLAKAEGPLGFERTVVLKILLSEMLFDGKETHDELSRMFAREAYAYARLGHPAIVRLFDFFSLPVSRTVGSELPGPPSTLRPPRSVDESQLVMVLEYVDGPSLSRLRSLLKAIGREMDDHAAIWIASRLFAGLAAAHAATDESGDLAPVVHRDVNPSNVLVTWDGEVKLADFGVAKVMGQSGESVAGMIKGTYGYMAPEQVTGTKVGPAADVYAGAIILWELLTKRRAFSRGARSEVEALRAMMEPELPSIDELRPDVDSTVRDALSRALRPRAADRTITAEEMVTVLHRAVPPVEGRDRLVAILGLVKNDARVSTAPVSSSDPSMHARAARSDNVATAIAPPLPAPSSRRVVKRTTAPYGNPASRPALPAASAPSMPSARTTSRGGMGAVHRGSESTQVSAGVVDAPSRTPVLPSSPPPALEPPARRPSASHRLAQALPETLRNPGERITTATPVAAPDIRDSIHDLLDGPIAPNETGRFKRTEILGQIPGSPEPMHPRPTPPMEHALSVFPKTPKAFDSSASLDFGGMRGSQPDLAPRFNETMAMEERPVPPPPLANATATATGPLVMPAAPPPGARYTPPGVTPVAPPVAMTPSHSLLPAATTPSQPLLPVVSPPSTPSHRPAYVSQPPMGAPFASAPPSHAPPAKRSNAVAIAAVAIVTLLALTSGGVLYVRSRTAPPPISFETRVDAPPVPTTASPVATAPVTAATPTPTVTAPEPIASSAPAEPASAAPAETAPSATEGTLKTTGALAGRRIFVDTAVVGQTPETVTVKCGEHVVRLGSSGKNQTVTVPCGGEITVADHY